MKKLLTVLLVCGFTAPAFGLREHYSISKSIRALGMGGAFYGLSNDEYAMFYNPAGLAYYEGGAQAMLSLNAQVSPSVTGAIDTIVDAGDSSVDQLVSSLSEFQGKVLNAGAAFFPYYVRKHFAIGLLAADTKMNFAILGTELDTSVEITPIVDSGFFVSYGRSFFDPNLVLGLTAKGMYRLGGTKAYSVLDLATQSQFDLDFKDIGGGGAGIDFDLGAMYTLPFTPWGTTNRVSLVINNILATDFSIARIEGGGAPPGLVRTISLGGHSRIPGVGPIDHFDAVFDLAEFGIGGETSTDLGSRSGSLFKHINFGVEAAMGWFSFRTGFRQGYWTAGLGMDARFFRLDLATYKEELLGTPGLLGNRRFALRLVFGISAAKPAPEPMTSPVEQTEPEPDQAEEPKEPVQEEKPVEEKPLEEKKTKKKTEGEQEARAKQEDSAKPARKPSSTKRAKRIEVPKDENDRFNVDRLVEEYPSSYNPNN